MKNKYELIVVGGGFAGVAAAISAAKEGVDVKRLQDKLRTEGFVI